MLEVKEPRGNELQAATQPDDSRQFSKDSAKFDAEADSDEEMYKPSKPPQAAWGSPPPSLPWNPMVSEERDPTDLRRAPDWCEGLT